jgi:hypothetical protein
MFRVYNSYNTELERRAERVSIKQVNLIKKSGWFNVGAPYWDYDELINFTLKMERLRVPMLGFWMKGRLYAVRASGPKGALKIFKWVLAGHK